MSDTERDKRRVSAEIRPHGEWMKDGQNVLKAHTDKRTRLQSSMQVCIAQSLSCCFTIKSGICPEACSRLQLTPLQRGIPKFCVFHRA